MSLTLNQVKAKSASKLSGLLSADRAAAEALIEFAYAHGVPIVITQGLRTIPEQDGLYAQGRTTKGQIVTNAKGGYSYHNFGVAIDFALLLPDGGVSWDTKRDGDGDGIADWDEVVADAKRLGWEWGGDWNTFTDLPHFEMTFGLSTADYRAGKRPTQAQLDKAIAKIKQVKEEADELSAEDKKRISDLEIQNKAIMMALESLANSKDVLKGQALQQAGEIKALKDKASIDKPPAWAQPAIKAAVDAGLLDTPSGSSYDFYRTLTVLHRAGVLITNHEGDK
ncbi:M15 family metallopeptidase [Paenibacillus monticola]|uniref:M15 family metallopeptidase n=1 Tax=Paenibacillus monticola TaxID=2666075 RepID=UPI0030B8D960